MRHRQWFWLKLVALTPLVALYSSSSGSGCTGNALRAVADGVDGLAQQVDPKTPDFGDVLTGLIENL